MAKQWYVLRVASNKEEMVRDALERKVDDQEGLKSAIDRYRRGITTNELEVNFF